MAFYPVLRVVFPYTHAVPGNEIRKILAADPVMPAGEPERGQLAGAYPPQDSGVAYTTALGNKTY